jgi:hypothetical protein
MKITNIILMALALICCQAMVTRGQQVIVTDDPVYTTGEASAVLDIKSDSKGLIIPRLTQSARDIITSPATGLIIFQTDGTPGFYYNAGTSSSPSWQLLGGESFSLPYAGSTSVDDFAFSVTNSQTHAIAGIATAASGTNFGVQGEAASPDGAGLFGYGSSTSGNAYGIIGQSASATGTGVLGIAIETTGANYGIKGQTFSSSGIGILGQAMAGNGTTYGVYGSVNSSSGYAGYFTGGKFYSQGNVGIGIMNPSALLHTHGIGMGEGNILFNGELKYTEHGNPPASGEGTRLMWYPDKAALRVGNISGNPISLAFWDKDNIGLNSFSSGCDTKASGEFSTALGWYTIASGEGSAAIGSSVHADGINSAAIGYGCEALGDYSVALGFSTHAYGNNSIAMGEGTVADGSVSTAMGYMTSAYGEKSTAMGHETIASGWGSTAMGSLTEASGYCATAMGRYSEATHDYSLATGWQTNAIAPASTAMGNGTTASGLYSTTMGYLTSASGFCAMAMGRQTIAPSSYETVIGRCNTEYSFNEPENWDDNDRLFVIGNGNSDVRRNALTMLKKGHTGLGTDEPEALVHLKSDEWVKMIVEHDHLDACRGYVGSDHMAVVLSSNAYYTGTQWSYPKTDQSSLILLLHRGNDRFEFRVRPDDGTSSSTAMIINAASNVGIGTTVPTEKLDVSGNARIRSIASGSYSGPVNRTSDGTLTTATSDIRLKADIQSLGNSLEKVQQLRGVSFTWADNPEFGTRIGMIAQEVEPVLPELVFTNETDGYMGVNYAEMSAVLVEAVKQQQVMIEVLQRKVEILELRNPETLEP